MGPFDRNNQGAFPIGDAMLGPQSAVADVGSGVELSRGGNLPGLEGALNQSQEPVVQHSSTGLNTPLGSSGLTDENISMWGKLKAGLNQKMGSMEDLSVGQSLGLGALSTGLKVAGAIGQINDEHATKMEAMRDDFDRQFENIEYESMRYEVAQEAQAVEDLIRQMNNVKAQNQGVASQTLSNQTQQFTRDPDRGGLV